MTALTITLDNETEILYEIMLTKLSNELPAFNEHEISLKLFREGLIKWASLTLKGRE